MLGHVNLATTAIYTRVSIKKLSEVHALTHPGARLSSTTQPALSVHENDEVVAERFEILGLRLVQSANAHQSSTMRSASRSTSSQSCRTAVPSLRL